MSNDAWDSMLHSTATESNRTRTRRAKVCPRLQGRQANAAADVLRLPHGSGREAPAGRGCEILKANSPRKIKCGFVTLTRTGEKWKARYIDPKNSKSVRRVLQVSADDLELAKEWANEMNRSIINDRGIIPGAKTKAVESNPGPSIADALLESLASIKGGVLDKARNTRGANAFQFYIEAKYPGATHWADIRPSMITAWIESMRHLAFDTVRLNTRPIRKTSRYWAKDYPDQFRDIFTDSQVKLSRKTWNGHKAGEARVSNKPLKPNSLTAEQLRTFLEWLQINAPHLYPIACLQSIAGLRTLEAAYIRHCDIDWNAGTVRITKTDLHTPKNDPSYRIIPVHPDALEAIRCYIHAQKIQEACEDSPAPVFKHRRGRPWQFHGLTGAWNKTITAARQVKELAFLNGFMPRKLRGTFTTLARQGKADVRALEHYLGHKPGDILGDHYEDGSKLYSPDDLRRDVVDAFTPIWNGEKQNSVTSNSAPLVNSMV